MLDVAPDVEDAVREHARHEGLTVNEYLARLVNTSLPAVPSTVTWQKSGSTSDKEKRAAVLAYLTLPRAEIDRLNAPSLAYFAARLAEAETATNDEIVAANTQWQTEKERMNLHRTTTGELPLYADTSTAE